MEKEFIPYEQALTLKELGFDEPCLAYWDNDGVFELNSDFLKGSQMDDTWLTAPLYQQAFRWFREEYFHYSFLQPTSDSISENYCFKILDQYSGKFYSKFYKKHEEAEFECLKKLIKIVK